jgi:hypothetical protein
MTDHPDVRVLTYRIDRNDIVVSLDEYWEPFAQENDAPGLTRDSVLGQPLWKFVEGLETRHIYGLILDRVRASSTSATIPYRCDSPDRCRYMEMNISPLAEGGIQFTNRFLREEGRDPQAILDASADRSEEFLTLCSWCKKVKLPESEWVDADVAVERLRLFEALRLPKLTHGICLSCDEVVRKELEGMRGAG